MPRWLPRTLTRIRALARSGRIAFTLKALRELTLLDFEPDHACEILSKLGLADFDCRFRSAVTSEWMYVFKPKVSGATLYLKLVVRANCVVISFHEDESSDSDEDP